MHPPALVQASLRHVARHQLGCEVKSQTEGHPPQAVFSDQLYVGSI